MLKISKVLYNKNQNHGPPPYITQCDSFHGIATIGESDRQMASLCGHVQTRADESGRERASVRGSESVVYTELIVLVFSFELDELEEGRAL